MRTGSEAAFMTFTNSFIHRSYKSFFGNAICPLSLCQGGVMVALRGSGKGPMNYGGERLWAEKRIDRWGPVSLYSDLAI